MLPQAKPTNPSYTEAEQEAIILQTICEMIDGMLNKMIFDTPTTWDHTTLRFHDLPHQKLFIILLTDFLSFPQSKPFGLPAPKPGARPSDQTFLFFLTNIVARPMLATDVEPLAGAIAKFADWLEGETVIDRIHLPAALIFDAPFKAQRMLWIKLCGDISKHSLARLSATEMKLNALLIANGQDVGPGRAYPVMAEFYQRFHDDKFNYHGSTIAEYLNNIRWAIFDYLASAPVQELETIQLEYFPFAEWIVPEGISDPLALSMWLDLMTGFGRTPIFPRFTIDPFLKLRS